MLVATPFSEALDLLRSLGEAPECASGEPAQIVATALMDRFRRCGESEVFERLVHLTSAMLLQRVRRRLRQMGESMDPHEVLQDAFVNIYRYPDRFDPTRPEAFRVWASTIVDNAVRRQLRHRRLVRAVGGSAGDQLDREADRRTPGPELWAEANETEELLAPAWQLFLVLYLAAFEALSPRERYVLQMVEVKGLRYAEVAATLGIRPEALKMVVFRARRRIFARMSRVASGQGGTPRRPGARK
jgi:RNA polymerase sigma-70 factor (ECF subfamily)